MENVTLREKAMLHLSRFPDMHPKEEFNVPFDLTQDGIATVLGISRAHASLELKKLKASGKADDWVARIRGSGNKRRAYYLLPDGFAEARAIKERIEASGVVIDSLLDMKRCDPKVMWMSLSPGDRETFGLACVIRAPIQRKTLPDTATGVIPTDFYGTVCIGDRVRENYLSVVDPEKVRTWHSAAADWWMENGDDHAERLHHLVRAGRHGEACRLALKCSDEFLDGACEDILESMKGLAPPPRHRESMYGMRSKIALSCGDVRDALACADALDEYGAGEGDMVRAEAALASGDLDGAFEKASAIFAERGWTRAALAAAGALLRAGRLAEADSFLASACEAMEREGDATGVGEALFLRAAGAYGRGKKSECAGYLSKALRACGRGRLRGRIESASEALRDGREPRF